MISPVKPSTPGASKSMQHVSKIRHVAFLKISSVFECFYFCLCFCLNNLYNVFIARCRTYFLKSSLLTTLEIQNVFHFFAS